MIKKYGNTTLKSLFQLNLVAHVALLRMLVTERHLKTFHKGIKCNYVIGFVVYESKHNFDQPFHGNV